MKVVYNGQPQELDLDQRVIIQETNGTKCAVLYMPGLPCPVTIAVEGESPVWSWNGDVYNPTFSPSILTRLPWGEEQKEIRNHVFVKDGWIRYLGDCTHEYAGQMVELPRLREWPEEMRLWDDEEA